MTYLHHTQLTTEIKASKSPINKASMFPRKVCQAGLRYLSLSGILLSNAIYGCLLLVIAYDCMALI